jgi:hypothetical protein
LTKDQYGNYVISHIIELGEDRDKARVIMKLKKHALSLAIHKFGSNVIEKCIKNANDELKQELLNEIIDKSSVDGEQNCSLMQLIRDKFGNFVVQRVLDESKGDQQQKFIKKIVTVASQIRSQNKACRHVFEHLEKHYGIEIPTKNNPIQRP